MRITGVEHKWPNDDKLFRTDKNIYADLAKQSGDEAPVDVVTPQENPRDNEEALAEETRSKAVPVEVETPQDSLWYNQEALAKEIRSKAVPVDYQEIMGQSRVLMLGETHDNVAARDHICTHAGDLKAAGITHYAIEAPDNPAIQRLNAGQSVDLAGVDLGPNLVASDKSYEHAVREMSRNGIKVVAVDIDQTSQPTRELSEEHITTAIKDILDKDPEAKVAVLIGAAHTTKKTDRSSSFPRAAERLESLGVPVVSAPIVGLREQTPLSFFEATEAAGMARDEFALDLHPYSSQQGAIYGAGAADFLINVPAHSRLQPSPRSVSLPWQR